MSGTAEDSAAAAESAAFVRAWREHRAVGVGRFLASPADGGFVAVDRSRNPPRVWVFRAPDKAGIPSAWTGTVEGATFDRELSPFASRVARGEMEGMRPLDPREVAALLGLVEGEESLPALSVRRFLEALPDDATRARAPAERLLAAEAERLGGAGAEAFRAALDEEALACLSAAEGAGWKDYAFYAVDGAGDPDPAAAARRAVRHQAARAYPMLAGVVAGRFGTRAALDAQARFLLARDPLKARLDAARAAGDAEGEAAVKAALDAVPKPPSLQDAIEKAMTPPATRENPDPSPIVSRAALARIQGIPFAPRGMRPESVAMAMSELPPDWFPKKGSDWKIEEWTAFTDLASTVGVYIRRLTGSPPEVLYEGCGGKWAAMRDRVVRAFTDTRPPGGDEEAVRALGEAIDWKGIEALPRHKVAGAARATADRLAEAGLPEGVSAADIEDWIVRLAAPPSDRATIRANALDAREPAVDLGRRFLVPLAVGTSQDAEPFLGPDIWEAADAVAARLLYGGKSAVKVFETLLAYRQNRHLIAGATVDEVAAVEMTAEQRRALALRKITADQDRVFGKGEKPAVVVGVDRTAQADWLLPFPILARAPNGLYLCPLFSKIQLKDEGRYGVANSIEYNEWHGFGPKHPTEPNKWGGRNEDGSYGLAICCGGAHHTGLASEGKAFYVSVREEGGGDGVPYRRLSLCRFSMEKVNGRWEVANRDKLNRSMDSALEHRGFGNANPSEAAMEAFEWFADGIRNGRIPHDLDNFYKDVEAKAAAKTGEGVADRLTDMCGYDWRRTALIARGWRAWHSVVSKQLRVPLERLARHPEVEALASLLSPGWKTKADLRREMDDAYAAGSGTFTPAP